MKGTMGFHVWRYSPQEANEGSFVRYEVPVFAGMTVLDALIFIKENIDATVSFRASCRMGICGSCAVMVNGIPKLACQTQVKDLKAAEVKLAPLSHFPVVRDLVVDLEPLFQRHREIKPFIMAEYEKEGEKENTQLPEQMELYLQFAYCLKCGICWAACPTVATDAAFQGPQALTQAYRYSIDTRDRHHQDRLRLVNNPHGVWRCHFAGNCSKVCPKGVDPALGIQLLKRALSWKRSASK